jgi:hypothetical protein
MRTRRFLLLLFAVVVLAICGMFVVRECYSPFALLKARYERIENGFTDEQVFAILGPPTRPVCFQAGNSLVWQAGPEYRDGYVCIQVEWKDSYGEVTDKWIHEPRSLWDRLKESLGLVEEEKPGSTFSF